MAGLQFEGREPRFETAANKSKILEVSVGDVDSQSVHNTEWLEGFEMAVMGMGGGFADSSLPRSKSPNSLSDFAIINDDQHSSYDYGIVDENLGYGSASTSAFPSIAMGEFNNSSDFDFALNPPLSIPP